MQSQTVLVTGTSSGFGAMISLELARAGHRVFASMRSDRGRDAEKADEFARLAEREGLALEAVALDVTDQASTDRAVKQILESAGRLDAVVHNAGRMTFGPVESFTPEQLVDLYQINAVGAHRLNRAVLPHMRERGTGLLVWNSSSSVHATWTPYLGPYFAAKAAMEQLATAYASETARFGIETALVVPGAFTSGTRHFEDAGKPGDERVARAYADGPTADLGDAILAGTKAMEPADADPAEVARAVRRIIDAPYGERPFRTTIDPSQDGSEAVAALQDRQREDTLERVGLADLLHPRRRPEGARDRSAAATPPSGGGASA